MFSQWRERRRHNRRIIDELYAAIVGRARRPVLFEACGIPDTVMGRFEALSLQMFLFLRRCRGSEALKPVAQDVVDRFIADMDDTLRQIGIGDQSVPKRMRKLAGQFYERVDAYDKAFASEDAPAAIARAFPGRALQADADADGEEARMLAREAIAEDERLAGISPDAILIGQLERETQP
ncbi:hypothetical protein DYI37_04590 [Fulvimarina endophytica]|uniref:Ubiquinol-cytochrome c chaperone domain-containing protein n=1 Tax=Fulvimarina endophytica TaxID=2293836 RepID=A0A371X7T4_9HYPH|nr:ubiquinol-cytochrome C chaperone family protein [Fulvimarina endophytica]RFC65134.1 hypothetical protein DYI37_04590 [Fulvimarina endophytica]